MKQTKNQSGFTLIEVLIAAVIIVFGLLSMGAFLGSYVNKNAENKHRTAATVLAQEKVEELRNLSLQAPLVAATAAGTVETVEDIYTRSWVVDATTDPKTVTVTVAWSGTHSGSQVVLSTLVNDS